MGRAEVRVARLDGFTGSAPATDERRGAGRATGRSPCSQAVSISPLVALLALVPSFGEITAFCAEFANKRGIYLGRRSTKIHVAIYTRSGGRLGGHVPGWPKARIALVDHTGARSGARRTSPVMYHETGDAIAVAASKAGQPTHPAWFHNLKANPDTTIQIGSMVREVRARVATNEEHERLWPEFVAFYPGYEFFQRHARGRKIPIVLLEPR
jgi:F420H(2)-dependent quinone reductase